MSNKNEGERPGSPKDKAVSPAPVSGKYLPGEHVVVRCEKFRCLAYLDPKGRWRAVHDGAELPEVLEVLGSI